MHRPPFDSLKTYGELGWSAWVSVTRGDLLPHDRLAVESIRRGATGSPSRKGRFRGNSRKNTRVCRGCRSAPASRSVGMPIHAKSDRFGL